MYFNQHKNWQYFFWKTSETTLVYGTRTLYTPLSDFNSICKTFNFSIKRIWKYIIMCWNFALQKVYLVILVSLSLQRILCFHHSEHIKRYSIIGKVFCRISRSFFAIACQASAILTLGILESRITSITFSSENVICHWLIL